MRAERSWVSVAVIAAFASVSACSGGGGESSSPPAAPSAPPPPPASSAFQSEKGVSRFLTQSTFGPTETDLNTLVGTDPESWLFAEFGKSETLYLPYVVEFQDRPDFSGDLEYLKGNAPTFAFWTHAISGDDQLRQRVAYALSQIIVVSHRSDTLYQNPEAMAYYQDILVRNAFGNYRDLLEEITYSPAMAWYLTYFQNRKGNPETGRVPDENYAREILQLFTIGLVELDADGTPRLDVDDQPIEIYDNTDITGLARVFTGLSFKGGEFWYDYRNLEEDAPFSPLQAYPQYHSELEKSFLGTTIPAGTGPEESIDAALDAIFDHPNVGPFIGRQLIQRLVTSNPSPAYVERVAAAFDAGVYTLPSGATAGDGRRGSMQATIAAILFDAEARNDGSTSDSFGKVREPVLRLTHWARVFDAEAVTPEWSYFLLDTGDGFGQAPYKSQSVFNFYRPGYVAPGTETGAADLVAPELQITNAGTVTTTSNLLTYFAFGYADDYFTDDARRANTLLPDYTDELALADDPEALADRLDRLLTYDTMSDETKAGIVEVISAIPLENPYNDDYDGPALRVHTAVTMALTSPDYIVQR